ncbi:GMC oxidoreductase-domain-containing protein [Mycena galericulata]|nr:GMC oxidoreductase-domain-containing protein [Mycena galericulata]
MHTAAAEYDIIFAGGGTAACVAAGRLAAADSTLRILIVENGRLTKDVPCFTQPARHTKNLVDPGMQDLTFHHATPGASVGGRRPIVSNGSCVGGGSSVNAMMYNRAAASDYDDWMHLGNPGWGAADLIPLACKLETYQAGIVNSTHGSSGPIKVSYGGYEMKAGKDFLFAAARFPRGRTFTEDPNDFATCDAYARWPKYIDAETGRRSDPAHFYIYNQAHNGNLCIVDHARISRVIFDADKRAVGVEYHGEGKDSALLRVYAARLVVVSAGAICSPAILQRSGIGGKDLLESHDIEVVSHLPGVGQNYNDHIAVFPPYLSPDGDVTLDSVAQDEQGAFQAQWLREGTGLLAANGMDAGIKLRPNAQDLGELTPLFTERWKTFYAEAPDKPLAYSGTFSAYIRFPPIPRVIYSMWYALWYPMSTGHVSIRSANPFAPLEIDTALLDRDEDLVVLRWTYKWSRELSRRMESYRGEYADGHPKFPEGSQVVCREAEGPVDVSAPEMKYTAEDDEAIDVFHRESACMGWHALGTCAMKPREAGGVVDPQLNVYGVKNLKVADMSIAPLNVGANTNNTALIIGEKAALVIALELGIKGV